MIILGLDPGYARLGYGLISGSGQRWEAVTHGVITTPATQPFSERLVSIHDALAELLKQHQPQLVSVEKLFFARNTTTAFTVGRAWGVMELTITQAGCPIVEFTPLQIKQTLTGYGQATKQQVQKMLIHIFHLSKAPQPDDAADALAGAYCAAVHPTVKQSRTRAARASTN